MFSVMQLCICDRLHSKIHLHTTTEKWKYIQEYLECKEDPPNKIRCVIKAAGELS